MNDQHILRAFDRDLILVVMPGNALDRAARAAGLRVANEIYADRTYDDDGYLMPRRQRPDPRRVREGHPVSAASGSAVKRQTTRPIDGARLSARSVSATSVSDSPRRHSPRRYGPLPTRRESVVSPAQVSPGSASQMCRGMIRTWYVAS